MRKYKITNEQFKRIKKYYEYSGDLIFEDYNDEYDDFDPLAYPDYVEDNDYKNNNINCYLTFGKSNAKINHPYFSLPAGYTCKFAKFCKSFADVNTGKITDTKNIKYRCYSASDESRYKNVRNSRHNNYNLLREAGTKDNMAELIVSSIYYNLLGNAPLIRIHESGDFFSQNYFDAWIEVAKKFPNTIFYAYTKSLTYWVARLNEIPSNFKLTASTGGSTDFLIKKYNLKYADVVFSVEEAKAKKLYIDKDDRLAWSQDKPFAILLHGTQPKGSEASKALQSLKQKGFTGYSRKNKK